MKLTDEALCEAVAELRDRRLAELSDIGEEPVDFSPEFLENMDRIIRRHKQKIAIFQAVRATAAGLLALLVCGGMGLAVDVDARAAFLSWTRETCEDSFLYRFFNE